MEWRDIILETIVASIVTGVFCIIVVIITNIFVNKRAFDKVDGKIGDLTNTTLSGQHSDIEKAIIEKISNGTINVLNSNSNINTKVEKINDIMVKNEGRYENLNLDQREVRNNINNLLYNLESTVSENKDLKAEIKVLKGQIKELTQENKQLKREPRDYPIINDEGLEL